jgi:hypothetical protein
LTTPISINSAHPLILVLSYSYLLPIKPDEERQQLYQGIARYFGIVRDQLSDKAVISQLVGRRNHGTWPTIVWTLEENWGQTGVHQFPLSKKWKTFRLSPASID